MVRVGLLAGVFSAGNPGSLVDGVVVPYLFCAGSTDPVMFVPG